MKHGMVLVSGRLAITFLDDCYFGDAGSGYLVTASLYQHATHIAYRRLSPNEETQSTPADKNARTHPKQAEQGCAKQRYSRRLCIFIQNILSNPEFT